MNAVPLAGWQIFKAVWGRFIRARNVVIIGEINALGPERIKVTPVEIRIAIPSGDKSRPGSRKPLALAGGSSLIRSGSFDQSRFRVQAPSRNVVGLFLIKLLLCKAIVLRTIRF
ncbi:MAG: hypothetical protein ACXAB4_00800 [Candidatus Hodarchaeales archaeon]|jgi:hypothetical protein